MLLGLEIISSNPNSTAVRQLGFLHGSHSNHYSVVTREARYFSCHAQDSDQNRAANEAEKTPFACLKRLQVTCLCSFTHGA